MAIFKVPKINTIDRQALVLELSELVFDTDEKRFYGGDGLTNGGTIVGAESILQIKEKIIVTQDIIDNNRIDLNFIPLSNFPLTLNPVGGVEQVETIDYERDATGVSFLNLGLENFFELGEEIVFTYFFQGA